MGHFLRHAFLSTRLDANSCLPSNDKKQKDFSNVLDLLRKENLSANIYGSSSISAAGFFFTIKDV